MAEALKGVTCDGIPYYRPEEVECAVDGVLALSREEIVRRLTILSSNNAEYIRDEVLMHLIRSTIFENNQRLFQRFFQALEARIIKKLPRGDDIVSRGIREYVVDNLIEMIAKDRQAHVTRLDIFECRFERGFKLLVHDAKRRVLSKAKRTVSIDVSDELHLPDEIVDGIRRLDTTEGDAFVDVHFRSDLLRAIAKLPDLERHVATLMLKNVPDVDNVSGGPSISSELGRSARMIQNYRAAAAKKLRRMLVDGEDL